MPLADVLKNARQKAFLSQEMFADMLNVSIVTVSRWENGKSKPNLAAMRKIRLFCSEYHVPYDKIEKEWFKCIKGVKDGKQC